MRRLLTALALGAALALSGCRTREDVLEEGLIEVRAELAALRAEFLALSLIHI